MPAKIRALFTSSRASVKFAKDRTTPGRVGESDTILNEVFSPNCNDSTLPAAPLTHECPDVYSGWAGVAIRGSQPASGAVRAFPSVAASGIAVTGRQNG